MRNQRDWAQYNNCKTHEPEQETTVDELNRSCNEFKAKFRNQAETFVDVVASVTMFAVTMVLNMTLCVAKRQGDHDFV